MRYTRAAVVLVIILLISAPTSLGAGRPRNVLLRASTRPTAKRSTTLTAILSSDSAWTSTPTFHPASAAEKQYLSCVRWAESRDSFWRWGYYPHGSWGDGGGAWQVESDTWLVGADLAHVNPADHSAGAQFRVVLVLLRHFGQVPWSGDGCVLTR